jgi:hypothetical protein
MEIVENRPMSKQWYECVKQALDESNVGVVEILMKMKFNEDYSGFNIIDVGNNVEVVKLLLMDLKFDPNVDYNSNIDIGTIVEQDIESEYKQDDESEFDMKKYASHIFDLKSNNQNAYNYPIIWASSNGYVEIVKLLLADPRVIPNIKKNYALVCAIKRNNTEVIKLFLEKGDIYSDIYSHMHADHIICGGNEKTTLLLLSSPYIKPEYGMIICRAMHKNYKDVVQLLLKDPQFKSHTRKHITLRFAVLCGYSEIVKLLLDLKVDINNDTLCDAISSDHIEVIKVLLQDSRLIIDMTCSYLYYLVYNSSLEVAKLLLADSRIDPSFDNNEMIISVSEKGHTEFVKLLLKDPRVDPTANNNKALKSAVKLKHYNIIKLLLNDPRVNPII